MKRQPDTSSSRLVVHIGVISDTHGYFDERLADALDGVDLILHAGDIGDAQILERLSQLAPVCAVRGNVDTEDECASLPESLHVVAAGATLFMTHIFTLPDEGCAPDLPASSSPQAVIFGHSHQQCLEWRDGILYFNPASAGRKRLSNPRSLGLITATPDSLDTHLIDL